MNWGDEAAHPDWISTKDFAPTDEVFYLIANQSSLGPIDDDGEEDGDIEKAEDFVFWHASLQPSWRWLANEERVLIPTTRVSTEQERELFRTNEQMRHVFLQTEGRHAALMRTRASTSALSRSGGTTRWMQKRQLGTLLQACFARQQPSCAAIIRSASTI